jgi:hypothetical protein
LSARYGHDYRGIVAHGIDGAVARVAGHAREKYQLMRIATVQGHFDDPLVVDDLAYARGAGFHLRSVCFDGHLLRHGADLKRHVNRWVAIDLQNDPALDVFLEAFLGYFQKVRAQGKIG